MRNFRFAIMGAGGISSHFCGGIREMDGCEVVAVSSKSMERARSFAERNGIEHFYDSYREMLEKEHPDCVYIGVLPNAHYELTMLCLEYKVPVLCEKAMFLNSTEAESAFRRAREQQVFVMEALWSRFLPAVRKVKSWMTEGRIGKPVFCDTVIGFQAPKGSENRYHNALLGGGAARDILVYAYELTTYMLPDPIQDIQVSVTWEETGVDGTDHVVLRFPDALASLTASFETPMEERMIIYGTEGKIILPGPHVASKAFLYDKEQQLVEAFCDEQTKHGFVYEIQETIDCIREGKIESDTVPHKSTLDCAKVFDLIDALGSKK